MSIENGKIETLNGFPILSNRRVWDIVFPYDYGQNVDLAKMLEQVRENLWYLTGLPKIKDWRLIYPYCEPYCHYAEKAWRKIANGFTDFFSEDPDQIGSKYILRNPGSINVYDDTRRIWSPRDLFRVKKNKRTYSYYAEKQIGQPTGLLVDENEQKAWLTTPGIVGVYCDKRGTVYPVFDPHQVSQDIFAVVRVGMAQLSEADIKNLVRNFQARMAMSENQDL